MLWLVVFVAFVMVGILLLFIKVNIHLSFIYRNGSPVLTIKLLVFKKCIYEKSLCIENLEVHMQNKQLINKMNELPKDLKKMFQAVTKVNSLATRFLQNIRLHTFEWKTNIGLGEASATGFMLGPVWMVKGMMTSIFLHKFNNVTHPKMTITPHFLRRIFETELLCIGSIRIGKAITVLINMRKIQNKIKKEEK